MEIGDKLIIEPIYLGHNTPDKCKKTCTVIAINKYCITVQHKHGYNESFGIGQIQSYRITRKVGGKYEPVTREEIECYFGRPIGGKIYG